MDTVIGTPDEFFQDEHIDVARETRYRAAAEYYNIDLPNGELTEVPRKSICERVDSENRLHALNHGYAFIILCRDIRFGSKTLKPMQVSAGHRCVVRCVDHPEKVTYFNRQGPTDPLIEIARFNTSFGVPTDFSELESYPTQGQIFLLERVPEWYPVEMRPLEASVDSISQFIHNKELLYIVRSYEKAGVGVIWMPNGDRYKFTWRQNGSQKEVTNLKKAHFWQGHVDYYQAYLVPTPM